MNMTDWARSEVEHIRKAFKKDDDSKDYAMACYETALKAFETVCEAGLTGFQVPIVKQIFDALIEGRPLSKLEESPDIWSDKLMSPEEKGKKFQCIRKSSLFKTIHADGSVTYRDVERTTMHDIVSDTYWYGYIADKYVDEYFPITMPYCPSEKKFVVKVAMYLTDRKNGDYDTIRIIQIDHPDGKTIVNIDEYFKESKNGWEQINLQEYLRRVQMHNDREKKEKEEHEDH